MRKPNGFVLLVLGMLVLTPAQAMDCPMVIVVNHSAPVDALSQKTIRRLYLGVPFSTQAGNLNPARNLSRPMLEQVFLQKILFMSEMAYRRVLATRLVRLREAGPPVYKDSSRLIKALQENPLLISYLWRSQLPDDGSLKVLLEVPCSNK